MTAKPQQLGLTQSEHIHRHTVDEHEENCHDGTSGNTDDIAGVKTSDQSGQASAVSTHHHPKPSIFSRTWHFVLHYVEMCLVMCIGGYTLNYLFFTGAAQLGYTNLIERYPEFSILMIGILLAIPMAVWMRIRGHEWRINLEMASTSIILAILLIVVYWLEVIPQSDMLVWLKRLACPIMLIPMLFRLDLYTGSHASHAQHGSPKSALSRFNM
ncbi:MAG: hypothetical protein EHM41_03070 [Chloroflexi bacterium]|nr:MAG: hypothetical protein EHM41_03070 [Chloroflexota bacterium]